MPRILVVDDYTPFLDEVARLMADDSTKVCTATTAAAAIHEMREHEFDVVVTDLLMETHNPKDGLAVVAEAKAHDLTQVIVVTSYGSPGLSVESMRLGAFDYLERGSAGTDFRAMLVSKIRLALDYRAAKLAVRHG
jgi:DNA-binding NtrC family response regulator